jgi:hypothetical protein
MPPIHRSKNQTAGKQVKNMVFVVLQLVLQAVETELFAHAFIE